MKAVTNFILFCYYYTMKPYLLLLLLLIFTVTGDAQPSFRSAASMPENVNLRRILEKPEVINTRVERIDEGSNTWISMEVDIHACTAIPLERMKEVITDYSRYTQIYRRTTVSRIAGRNERGTLAFFEVSVGALGIYVVSSFTLLKEINIDTPDSFYLTFTHVSDDGTIRNILGSWYLRKVEIDGRTYTYMRYFSSQDSLQVAILQRQAASMFIGSEYTGMLRETLAAAR